MNNISKVAKNNMQMFTSKHKSNTKNTESDTASFDCKRDTISEAEKNYGIAGIEINKLQNRRTDNFNKFVNEYLRGENPVIDSILATHDFGEYGKDGIPLKYPRKECIHDILTTIEDLSDEEKAKTLEKFNLRLGGSNIFQAMDEQNIPPEKQQNIVSEIQMKQNDRRDINTIIYELPKEKQEEIYNHYGLKQNIGDLDGIAIIPDKTSNEKEEKIKNILEEFYYNNESVVDNPDEKKAFDTIIKGFPEFNMAIGKHQHVTHIYAVDVHSFVGLKSDLQNPKTETLSKEGKEVLKLAVLMHDFGKKGNLVTTGHAAISKTDGEKVLERYNLPENIKERVIRQIEYHHWFEKYNNKHEYDEQDVLNIFGNEEDLTIAKIMAKGDLEGVSPIFHRKILHPGVVLTQEEFNKEFGEKTDRIHF